MQSHCHLVLVHEPFPPTPASPTWCSTATVIFTPTASTTTYPIFRRFLQRQIGIQSKTTNSGLQLVLTVLMRESASLHFQVASGFHSYRFNARCKSATCQPTAVYTCWAPPCVACERFVSCLVQDGNKFWTPAMLNLMIGIFLRVAK